MTLKTQAVAQLRKRLAALNNGNADAGFFNNKLHPAHSTAQNPITITEIAGRNELGYIDPKTDQAIPERAFIRTSIRAGNRNLKRVIPILIKMVFDGKITGNRALIRTSMVMQQEIMQSIENWTTPPNAPRTIEDKGFNDPLVDSGIMQESVQRRNRAGKLKK